MKLRILQETYNNILRENNSIEFVQDSIGYAYGQHDLVWNAYHGDDLVGQLSYSDFENTPAVKMLTVVPKYRGRGIASKLMEKLVDEYGYRNIDLGMLTQDGAGLIKKLDKLYGFDREAELNRSKHWSPEIFNQIKAISTDVWNFMTDYYKTGNEVWQNLEKYNEKDHLIDGQDPNDLADIVRWIEGAKENDNNPKEAVPNYIEGLLEDILNQTPNEIN